MTRSARRATRPAKVRARSGAAARGGRVLRAIDLMSRSPVTVLEELRVGQLCDLFQEKNINGAPVVDAQGRLVGVVTQEDVIYGAMGHTDPPEADPLSGPFSIPAPDGPPAPRGGKGKRDSKRVVELLQKRSLQVAPPPPRGANRPFWAETAKAPDAMDMPVSSIMTSPAISAEEDTPVVELCRLMWSLRIHRVPILKNGKVTGLVSSMDMCRAILEGKIRL
jgi:CBS domain-containing protein